MSDPHYRVILTRTAKEMLRSIGKRFGKKTYETLRDLILNLEFNPDQKGRSLRHPLHGFHSLHYSRFRIVYRIERDEARVLVIAAGWHTSGKRDDIYQILQRLLDSGMIELKDDEEGPEKNKK